MTGSVEKARRLLSHRYIIFFEVWVDDDEDVLQVAAELAALECRTSIDPGRGVVRAFAPGMKPGGLSLD